MCGQERVDICIHYLNGHKGMGGKCGCGIFDKYGEKVNARMRKERFKRKINLPA